VILLRSHLSLLLAASYDQILIFDPEKLVKIGKSYDIETSIQLKLHTVGKAEGSEGSEGFRKEKDINEQNSNIELTTKENNYPKIFEQTLDIKSNILLARNEKPLDNAIKLSELSEPSGSDFVSGSHKDLNISNTIYRLGHSDTFACKNCKVKGDKFFMESHVCKISKSKESNSFNILDIIKCKYIFQTDGNYGFYTIPASPASGVLHVNQESRYFIHGSISMKGKGGGSYPYNYLEMIDNIFGSEENTIEVCSGSIKGRNTSSSPSAPFTVDINPAMNPDYVGDAQKLDGISSGIFIRGMGDPPYNNKTARKMYGTELPIPIRLLEAGARVCKPGSLMFLLLGNSYQPCPKGVKRIGCIAISVIPNNEVRFLNIYYKYEDV
jgi:hypothetical protein